MTSLLRWHDENGYWDSEGFEETLSLAIEGMHNQVPTKFSRMLRKKQHGVSKGEIEWMRNVGPYFPPGDRIASEFVDIKNDGIPKTSSVALCFYIGDDEEYVLGEFSVAFLRRMKPGFLPADAIRRRPGPVYALYRWFSGEKGKVDGWFSFKNFVTLHKENFYPVICSQWNNDEKLERKVVPDDSDDAAMAAATWSFWQDRRYLWNVVAVDDIMKVRFGVHAEQIKSLFFARQAPKTDTGRKRPILHWVKSHTRRIREGVEIDIEKHLRGTPEFIMDGTKFIISRPVRKGTAEIQEEADSVPK